MSEPEGRDAARADERRGSDDELARFLAEMVADASDGEVTTAEVLASALPFSALGVTSLTQIRLIDSIERTFDIDIDLAEDAYGDLRSLAEFLRRSGVQGPP
jgi:acyl carrier protein